MSYFVPGLPPAFTTAGSQSVLRASAHRRGRPARDAALALAPACHALQAADASTWGKFAAPFILNLGSAPRHARIAALEPRLVRKS